MSPSKAKSLLDYYNEVKESKETNCDNHTFKVAAKFDVKPTIFRHDIVSALLRQLALYTDGQCAYRGAGDDDIIAPSGIVFQFTSDAKRDEFIKKRINGYLPKRILDELIVWKI